MLVSVSKKNFLRFFLQVYVSLYYYYSGFNQEFRCDDTGRIIQHTSFQQRENVDDRVSLWSYKTADGQQAIIKLHCRLDNAITSICGNVMFFHILDNKPFIYYFSMHTSKTVKNLSRSQWHQCNECLAKKFWRPHAFGESMA